MPVSLDEAVKLVAPEKREAFLADFAKATPAQIDEWYSAKVGAMGALPAPTPISAETAAGLGTTPAEMAARIQRAPVAFASGDQTPTAEPPPTMEDMARPAPAPGLLPEPSAGQRSLAVGPPEPPTRPVALRMGATGVDPEAAAATPDLTPREWRSRHQVLSDVVVPMAGGLAALPAAGAGAGMSFLPRAGGALLRSGLFSTGAEAADIGLRALYGEPQKSGRETAVNMGLNFLAPVGGEIIGAGARRVSGVAARAEELAAAKVAAEAKAVAAREAADDAMAIGFPRIHTKLQGIAAGIRDNIDNLVPKKVEADARTRALASKRDAYKSMLALDTAATDARIAGAGGDAAVDIQRSTAGKFKDLYDLAQRDFGEVFEAARAPHVDKDIPEAIRNSVSADAAESLKTAGAFAVGGDVLGPMHRLKGLAPDAVDAVPGAVPAGGLPPGVAEANARAAGILAEKKGEEEVVPKIGELLEIKGHLQSYMKRGGPDRHLASEGLGIINDALDKLGVDGVLPAEYVDKFGTWGNFKARYANWRGHMDKGFLRRLYTAETADDLAGLFKSEKLLALVSHAQPEDVQALRTAFHDLVVQKGLQDKPEAIFKIIGGTKAMDALYGPAANDALKWARVNTRIADLGRLIDADPSIGREMRALSDLWTKKYLRDGQQKAQEALVAEFQHFGPMGKAYARDLAQLTPDQAWTKYMTDVQGDPAAFRQSLLDATHEHALTTEVAKRVPTHVSNVPGFSYPVRGVSLYHASQAATALMMGGGSAKYHGAMAAGALGLDATRFLRRGFVGMLETPRIAGWLEKINSPSKQNIRDLIRMSSQVAAADMLQHLGNAVMYPAPQPVGMPTESTPVEPPPLKPDVLPAAAHGQFPQGSAPATPPPAPQATPPPQQQMAQSPQPPHPDPVQTELAIHQMAPWKFRNVQAAGTNFTDPTTVGKFQAAYDQGVQRGISTMVASPAYKQASPKDQKDLLKRVMLGARQDAVGMLRKDLAGKLKADIRGDEVATATDAPDSLR